MEGRTNNPSFDHHPSKRTDYRAADETDGCCDVDCTYQSVSYDSGICLSNYKSTEKVFASNEVVTCENSSIEERLRDLNLRDSTTSAVQMTRTFQTETLPQTRVDDSNDSEHPCSLPPTGAAVDGHIYIEDQLYQQDEEGDTRLHLAIIRPDVSFALRIIEMTQVPDYLDIQNKLYMHTPLHLAVITNQPQIVRALVISGASLTARDRHGNTALHLACKHGVLDCVRQLTAPPNEEEQYYVLGLCESRRLPGRLIKPMLPTDINLMNYEGESSLHLALTSASETRMETINYLVNCCHANVNVEDGKCGNTILHQSIKMRDTAMVQFLLLHFPQLAINQMCYSGCTALDVAHSLNQPDVEAMLLMRGAVSSDLRSCNDVGSQDDGQVDDYDDIVVNGFRLDK